MQTHAYQPARPAGRTATGPVLLQRKCSCGGHCASCSKRRLDRKADGRSTRLPVASRIVSEVLASPGHAIGERLLDELEPQFHHDFSGVRVHDDARADESCRAVGAAAYTVGEHVAFASGRFRPETHEGRRLLLHELAHVVQQADAPASGDVHDLTIMAPDTAQEREADRVAERVLQGGSVGRLSARSSRRQIQRDTTYSCGVEVTDLVKGAVSDVKKAFGGWSEDDKVDSCQALSDIRTGDIAWDIVEMHRQVDSDWLNSKFRPPCATSGATPACGSSVTVDGDCHFAGSANYVIYGAMCRLCSDFASIAFKSHSWYEIFDRDKFQQLQMQFSESGMLGLIDLYKKWLPRVKFASVAGNIEAAKAWSKAGYNGWPGVKSPPGDRSNCVTDCPHTADYSKFTVSWYPNLNAYERRRGVRPD
jgi:hypothetical protein